MILDEAIAWALPDLQAEAEGRMTDTCRITRAGERTFDEATGTYPDRAESTIYEGKCRLRAKDVTSPRIGAGGTEFQVLPTVLSLPVSDTRSDEVKPGDRVLILTSLRNPALVDAEFTVDDPAAISDMTARRFGLKEVSADDRRQP